MNEIETLLTHKEMNRLKAYGFDPYTIFGSGNYCAVGPLLITGQKLNIHNEPECVWDKRVLDNNLPQCKQCIVGSLFFYTLPNNRRLVVFQPTEKGLPVTYLQRITYSPEHKREPKFFLRTFPGQSAQTPNPFGEITPVYGNLSASEDHQALARQNIPAWVWLNPERDEFISIALDHSQWKLITDMLNAWIPE